MTNQFWKIKNAASGQPAVIELYGEITSDAGWYRIWDPDAPEKSAVDFAKALKDLDGADITLRINSPGGEVFQAQAIHSLLKGYKGHISCHIDGLCASAATLVAAAADEVVMPENALYMIHNPRMSYLFDVDKDELAKVDAKLTALREAMVAVYSTKCGEKTSNEEISQLMDAETWMTAQEALDHGFIDAVDNYGVTASITAGVLSINGLAMPSIVTKQQAILSRINAASKKGGTEMSKDNEVLAKIRDLLGLKTANDTAATAAADAEKERILALDALKGDGKNPYVTALVEAAKAGKDTAEELSPYLDAVKAVKAPESDAMAAIKALVMDQMESGAGDVKPVPAAPIANNDHNQKTIDEIVAMANAMRK